MPEQDYWDSPTESGLPDDFTITIGAESFFAPSAILSGSLALHIVGVADKHVFTADEPLLVTVGKGWQSLDGGHTVVHPDGKIKFSEQTHLGSWVKKLAVELGAKEAMRATGRTPLEAAFWHGMTLHLLRMGGGETFMGKDGAQVTTKPRLMPTQFSGYQGASVPPVTGGQTVAPAAPAVDKVAEAKAKVAAAKAATTANGSSELEGKVRAMAAEHADYAAFEAAVLTLDGITDDDTLLAAALDQTEAGIYAQAHTE